MKKLINIFLLFVFGLFIFLSSCSKENQENCTLTSCWGNGDFDESQCSCECETDFTGIDCATFTFTQCTALEFNVLSIDYTATANTSDLIEIDGIQWIKKGSNPYRYLYFKNISSESVIIIHAKGNTGALVPTYPKDLIQPNEEGEIKVRFDTNRSGERFMWIDLKTSACDYKLAIKVRVAE